MRARSFGRLALTLGLLASLAVEALGGDDPAAVEFFEAKVRPLLVARCQSCHGNGKAKGGLKLENRAEAIHGGDTGPALVPGKPDESLIVEAIRYGDALQMPPKSKLAPEEIATLTRWVEQGAPWPVGLDSKGGSKVKPFNLRERAEHWSLQPIKHPDPPEVKDASWPINPVDRFLLAKLEAKGLKPALEADKPTLIRRLTFDLIGLPPTPAEVEAFVLDPSPDAYEKLVERLLASPHHGERWGRHWLDLVRFAETSGHEFDYEIPLAYRYRDYVIRAFNLDLPYDQFVVENLAGDLLPDKRRDAATGLDESTLGTGSFRLHEGVHSPVDLKDDAASKYDSQIDVLGKAFLGLTLACARCHDHKFDAITTKDYYALNGILASSRHTLAFLDPPSRFGPKLEELEAIRLEVASHLQGLAKTHSTPAPIGSDLIFETFDGPSYAGWFPSARRSARGRPRRTSGESGAMRSNPSSRASPTRAPSPTGSGAPSGRRRSLSPNPTSTTWPGGEGGGSTW